MKLLLLAIVVGVALGYASGRSVRNIRILRIRWWGVAAACLVVQLIPLPTARDGHDLLLRIAVFGVVAAALGAFSFVNRRTVGCVLIAAGLFSNSLVVAVNGRMPISLSALQTAAGRQLHPTLHEGRATNIGRYQVGGSARLAFLGDTIGLPPPVAAAASPGDFLLMLGIVLLTATSMAERQTSNVTNRQRGSK